MTIEEMCSVITLCAYPGYTLTVCEGHGGIYLQGSYLDADIVTGDREWQFTRKWLLSPSMTKSEIVQTCFKLVLTSMEHRSREGFTYRGKRVFGPHFDVEALYEICANRRLDVRPRSEERSVPEGGPPGTRPGEMIL